MSVTAAVDLTTLLGATYPPVSLVIDRSRLRLFAQATGQTDPVYTDVEAARRAGHPDLLVPPTFLFGVELERPSPFAWLTDTGVRLTQMLHASQTFDYLAPAHAGDEVTGTATITDVQVKKGGALTFVERATDITCEGRLLARLTNVAAIRNAA